MTHTSNGGRSSATPRRLSNSGDPFPDHPDRKRPAHFPTVEAGSRSIIIFLTICTKRRRPLLANDRAVNLLLEAWRTAANSWIIGRYVILPDHLHLFCAPNTNLTLRNGITWETIQCVMGMFGTQGIGPIAVN